MEVSDHHNYLVTNILPKYFQKVTKMYYFVFQIRKKVTKVWNNIRVSNDEVHLQVYTILILLVPKEYTPKEHAVLCVTAETWRDKAEKKEKK